MKPPRFYGESMTRSVWLKADDEVGDWDVRRQRITAGLEAGVEWAVVDDAADPSGLPVDVPPSSPSPRQPATVPSSAAPLPASSARRVVSSVIDFRLA